MKRPKGVVLVVMDGWGLAEAREDNAIAAATTPVVDGLWKSYPHATLAASGEAVGLPDGQMGTSEVNHLTLGAGRIVYQDLVRINKAIAEGSFNHNQPLLSLFASVVERKSKLHLWGLVSDGGVHSHIDHIKAILTLAKTNGIKQVYLHAVSDGRDTLPQSGVGYFEDLIEFMEELGIGKIVSLSGRYFAMDRDHNWDRTDKAFAVMTRAESVAMTTGSAVEALKQSYADGVTDEFVEPILLEEDGVISDNDGVLFVNFRTDRPRQIVERFLTQGPKNLRLLTLTQYNPDYPIESAFEPVSLSNCVGEVVSLAGRTQLRVTETEKFAHVTYFFNCKEEKAYEGEDRMMLDSYSDIPTHDHRPAMRADDIAKQVVEAITTHSHHLILTNVCNCDMVGHTGNFPAIIKAVEATDTAVGKIVAAAITHEYAVIVTADHGNAEETIDPATLSPLTSHTLNPVPCIVVWKPVETLTKDTGLLIDVAPTILKLMGIKKPLEMTGESLV